MPPVVRSCSVCRRESNDGSHDVTGEVFICAACEADAKQFLAIQDAMWPHAPGTPKADSAGDVSLPARTSR